MTIYDLNREQIIQVKQDYLTEHLYEVEGRGPSYGELVDADTIVPDWIILEAYACYDFSDDDFFNGGIIDERII